MAPASDGTGPAGLPAPAATPIPFNDLTPLHRELGHEISAAIERVMQRGVFILGPEGEAFEAAFAAYTGAADAVSVASGTDAIELALRAAGIGRGDEVITVSHTAVATVCGIERAGATPVLVDIDPRTYTMDPAAAEAAITPNTRAIVPVHLYGHPADAASLRRLADRHHLLLLEDCAQAHGALLHGQRVGSFGHLAAFSFYPTKNLGACGDAGAVVTTDAQLARRLRRLRNYGATSRDRCTERGVNSRLDEMQAAILLVKLRHLDRLNSCRRDLARRYGSSLEGVVTPIEQAGAVHVFHLYVVRHPERDRLAAALAARRVATLVHYPLPVHLQPAYADLGYPSGSLPVTEAAAGEILSLPLYVGLPDEAIARVARVIAETVADRHPRRRP